MATNPSGSDIQLQINTTYNASNILTVDGAYRVPTASPNEIVISGCRTTTLDGGPVIYWLTTINYGTSTSTNIFTAGTYHSRTFVGGGARPLYGGNLSGDPSIVKSATNLGQALNGGGSDIYYVYAANLDSNGVWSNFVRCTFSNSVSGVSTNYFTVTWTDALRGVTISAGSSGTASIPANSSTNWRSSYDAIVLGAGDLGYAIDFTLSGSGTHNNIWYATPYTVNVTRTTSPFQSGGSVGRTYGLSASTMRLENSSNSAANEVESIPSEGYAVSYRLWGRTWPGSTSTYSGTNYDGTFNVTDGREYDGYYYNGGLYTACRPDTNVTVNGSTTTATVNIGTSDTQANVTVGSISSSDQNGFQWRYNGSASGTYGAGSVSPTSTNLPIITNLPASGSSRVFNLYVKNFSTNSNTVPLHDNWIDTGKTVTVTRSVSITQPTVNNTQTFNTTSASATFSHSIALSSSGSGGTLEYAITQSSARNTNNPSTTLPTSGWQTSSTFTLTRGYYYHFWARRSAGSGDRTNTSLQAPYLATSTNATIPGTLSISSSAASFDVTVGNVSENHTYRLGTNTTYGNITGTNSPYSSGVVSSGQTTATITIPSAASLYPSTGGSATYYLYVSRTSASGGSGDTGSFSSPGWYNISGESIVVSRGSGSTSSGLDITNTANYGLEIRNGSNQVTFDPSVRNIRKVNGETFSVNVAAGTSYTQTISGVTPTNDDEIAIIGGYAYSGPAYGASGVIVTRQNGSIKFNNTNSYFAFVATFEVIRL